MFRNAVQRTSAARARSSVTKLFLIVFLLLSQLGGILHVQPALAAPVTAVDDAGADDEPGQKDLNALTVDYGAPGATTINVKWNWDDTATSGANTRDGGALFARTAEGTWERREDLDVAGASLRAVLRTDRYVYLAGTSGVLLRHVVLE